MTSCDDLWLAVRVVWWVLTFTVCGLAIFFAGYNRGRRVETEARGDAE